MMDKETIKRRIKALLQITKVASMTRWLKAGPQATM